MLRINRCFRHFQRAYAETRIEVSSGREIFNSQTLLGRAVNVSFGFGYVLLAATFCFGSDEYIFNTDDGTMTFDGNLVTEVHGTPFVSSEVGGIQQFRFLGDLTFVDFDRVFAFGSRPLSLFAGNDVDISSLALFDFDAVGQFGELGGGNSGSGSGNSGLQGFGGNGGNGGSGSSGG